MPGIVDGTRNLEALEDKPLIWVGGNAGPGKTTLIASALAKREVAGTWYLGARLAAAALPDLIRGMSAPEVLILDGRRTWAPTHPFTNFSWRACPKFQRARLKLLPTQADAGGIFSAQARQACNEVLVAGISVDSARGRIPRHARPTAENASDEWPWTFRVHVLGRFRLHKADAALGRTRSTQPKPIELLQVLIAFGGTEVCAGKLIDALWPDADGDAGYHALETTLYRLRRVLDASEAVQINHPIGQLINKALSIG